jgi:hypothetical protein
MPSDHESVIDYLPKMTPPPGLKILGETWLFGKRYTWLRPKGGNAYLMKGAVVDARDH